MHSSQDLQRVAQCVAAAGEAAVATAADGVREHPEGQMAVGVAQVATGLRRLQDSVAVPNSSLVRVDDDSRYSNTSTCAARGASCIAAAASWANSVSCSKRCLASHRRMHPSSLCSHEKTATPQRRCDRDAASGNRAHAVPCRQ
jgi:hypothetical protein